jgi:predicted secreted protein
MMKLGITLAAVLAVAVSAPAVAKDDGDKAPAKEKKICRTERTTGSLVAKRRICKTQAEWDEIAANARKNLDDYSRRQGRGAETGSGMGANSGF